MAQRIKVDAQKASEWLNRQWSSHSCPFCGTSSWEGGDYLVTIQELPLLSPQTREYPHFILTCTKCGYAVLVNAIVSGMVAPEDADDDKSDTGENGSSNGE